MIKKETKTIVKNGRQKVQSVEQKTEAKKKDGLPEVLLKTL